MNEIFGMSGEANNGMVKFTIGRAATMHGVKVDKDMGVNTWAAFAGTDDNAVVDGGFVVEASAAITILFYLIFLRFSGRWNQTASMPGINYSILTGLCVGVGTIAFFLLFQKGGPLSAVPAILAVGAAMMALAGILFFKESLSPLRLLGVAMSIAGLLLLRC